MTDSATQPALEHLYRLGQQLEADREQPVEQLRQRDHDIGRQCTAGDDSARLLFWLERVRQEAPLASESWLNEQSAAMLLRAAAVLFGIVTMVGFLLAGDRDLVNVQLFSLVFVLMQLLVALSAGYVMLRSLRGSPPTVFPLNPSRFVTSRALPDTRYIGEASGVLRLLLLRYGQEFGALFMLGAIAAFVVLTRLTTINFVWGSTIGEGDNLVSVMTRLMSLPWSGWLPQGVPSAELIRDSWHNPATSEAFLVGDESRRSWRIFLLMSMFCYGLVPRVVLWLASRLAFTRELRRSFACFPGAETVLMRMARPLVRTQAEEGEAVDSRPPLAALNEGAMLLDWAGALDQESDKVFEQLLSIPPGNLVAAGVGSPEEDNASLAAVNRYKPDILMVAVKSWEPPMADLADTLSRVTETPRCQLCLVPLPGREVAEHSVDEWTAFARELPFAVASAQALQRV